MGTTGHKSPMLAEAANFARGVLIVGHGTQEPAGLAEFFDAVARIAQRLAPAPVEPGLLEFAEPTIAAGITRLIERGARRLVVVPLVLFAAGHAKRDIPAAVAAAVDRTPGVQWRSSPHLGCAEPLVRLSVRRFHESCAQVGDDTLLIFVGRGSHDAEASAELRRFAELRFAAAPVGRQQTAFVAMAEPSLESALDQAGRSEFRQIIVQPHLLFTGKLIDRVRGMVEAAKSRFSDRQWRVTGHLGVADELIDAVVAGVDTVRFH